MRQRTATAVWWWIVVGVLVTLAHAGQPVEERMPPHAGIVPGQKEIQVRLEKGTKNVPDAEVRAALTASIAAWNAVLPADLKFVEKVANDPLPVGEVVVLVRFQSDPKDFGGKGVHGAGDIRGILDRKNNRALVALFLVDTPAFVKGGGFSTTGAPAARDLQLVMMHELGHVLGIEHIVEATTMPPIMAEVLDANATLLAGGKKLGDVRKITGDDTYALNDAMLRRNLRDVAGSYTGQLEVTSVGKGTGGISVGTKIQVRDGDLVIKLEAGKVMVDFKGSKRELPAIELLSGKKVALELEDVADQKALRTMTITRGESPEEIVVLATLQPLKVKYSVKGTLKRK